MATNDQKNSAARDKRTTSDQTRAALLAAGRRLIDERGLSGDPLGVGLGEVSAIAGLPRSSAYHAFQSPERPAAAEFTQQLIASLLTDETAGDFEVARTAALEVIAVNGEVFTSGTPKQLAEVLQETIRVGVRAQADQLHQSPAFFAYVCALAGAGQNSHTHGDVSRVSVRNESRARRAISIYRDLTDLFGLQLRPGWTWEAFDATVFSSVLGVGLRAFVDDEHLVRHTGTDQAEEVWSIASTTFQGIVMVALEPNPRMKVAADLSSWI